MLLTQHGWEGNIDLWVMVDKVNQSEVVQTQEKSMTLFRVCAELHPISLKSNDEVW